MEKEKIREQKLISLIEKQKESEFIDFKQEFYHKEATQDLIKDVISFANAQSNEEKYIIFGVADTYELFDIVYEKIRDISELNQVLKEYCEPFINVEFYKFTYKEKKLLALIIANNVDRPYLIKKDYQKNGSVMLRVGDIYIRHGATTFNIITIDSSSYEAQVREDIPFTNIGYVKLVNYLLKNKDLLSLKGLKFVNPFEVAKLTDEKETITFVLPSSNVKYKDAATTRESFRLALDEYFESIRDDKADRNTSLKSTLFWLSSFRKEGKTNKIILHKCPNGCGRKDLEVYNIEEEQYCPECHKRIFATDTLRLFEEIDEASPSNQGVLGRFEKVIRHIHLAHLLRILRLKNKESYFKMFNSLAIVINGPLSVAGTAAWVHGSLMKAINEINIQLREKGYTDLMIIGLINGGLAINDYANLIEKLLEPNSLLCVSDEFRDKYINFNREASGTTFGAETYYGQDFIWKNEQGNILIFDLPYIVGDKSRLEVFKKEKSDYLKYNNLHRTLRLLQELKCDMDASSVAPLVISKQYTAISMEPGTKVLDMLSKNNLI